MPADSVVEYVVREFDLDIANGTATGVAVGPDGGIWFTETDSPGAIGRFDPGTEETEEFTAGLTEDGEPNDIVAGPQGALWFTTRGAIGRITTQGAITEFRSGITPGAFTRQLTVGPDGALWFTEANDRIGRLDPVTGLITEFAAGITAGGRPEAITTGPDGNIWFTLPGTGRGLLGGRRLRPGTYILVVRAYDGSGNRSPDTIVKFWVPRRR